MAIDEKKLIEELRMEYECVDDLSYFACGAKRGLVQAISIIKRQPKVGGWISVEERLPNEDEFEKNYCRNHWGAEFIVMIKGANRPTSLYYKEGVWFDDDNNDYDVIAWQPLPEPYSSGD